MKSVFVTTGATVPFIPLLELFLDDDVLNSLINQGFSKLVIQYGNAPQELVDKLMAKNKTFNPKLEISGFTFKKQFIEEINKHDLIISHAGTGSILDAARQHKPLIVVVNPALMDNHQLDIATALSEKNHLISCPRPDKNLLLTALNEKLPTHEFEKLPPPNGEVFSKIVYARAGLVPKKE